jgi:type VI secretion system protein ImpL
MGYFGYYIVFAVFGVIFLAISWIVTGLLHLSGMALMVVRMVLMGLVFALWGLFHWQRQKKQRRQETEAQKAQAAAVADEREIESFVRDAENRLATSSVGKEARLGNMPIYFLVGETGAAKTSLFVHSGVEPDLLAGQVYQDANLVPTRPVNIWLAQKSVFVEAGGRLLTEAGRWMRLVRRLQPAKRRLFGGQQPPRGVIVCVDTENFLKPGADEMLSATARNLNARLGEISQVLGVRLPVYVLFSKLDRLGFFTDYVGNLTDEEVHQVLGVTLPLAGARDGGVYAEEESRRLTAAFDGLFHALCDKRLPFLARENDWNKLPAIYELPREFRKLRNATVRLLVDLGRPSQLRVNPFLRGFYFSGVRPVVVKESVPSARASLAPPPRPRRGATGFFDEELLNDSPADASAMVGGTVRTRRTPQWLFLGHLFSDVILRDRTAMGASGESVRAEMARRALLGAGAALLALVSVGMTVSYFRNRGLESRVDVAARGIARGESGGGGQELPSRDSLERLDTLRDSVELLSQYEREGPPLSLRWGLYVGGDLYPTARTLYFDRFKQLLFGSTQLSLVEWLHKLPAKPGPNDQYKPTYDTLKAYLITTSHHEKSARAFLSPLLFERWAAGRQIDPDRAELARRQFDFYSDELLLANPYSSANDGEAVEWARSYLAQFNAVESIYQFILAEATRQKPAVNFNRQFKGSNAYVVNNHDVAGAFTVEGWKFVDDAINNIKRFFGGEAWVLGDHAIANVDQAALGPQLRDRYHQDFIGNWRAYLSASEIVPYHSVGDAAQKLGQLSSNQSYLLALICLASVNTDVSADDVSAPYQPVQYVTPPKTCTDRYIEEHNNAYASALVSLQASMDRVAKSGSGVKDDVVAQTESDATNAYKVTRQIAQNFRIDHEGNVHGMVQKLMEDPIRYAEAVLGRLGPAQLNTEGQRLCTEFGGLAHKYPFDTGSKTDATLDEVDAIFRPDDGKLAAFYESTLKNYLDRRGGEFVRKSDSKVQITDGFLRFLNRATALSDALYKNGSKSPGLTYNMKAMPAEGLRSLTLTLDGQVLKSSGAGGESKDFVWPGPSHNANMSGNMGGPDLGLVMTQDSLWAVFRFFADADRFQSTGGGYTLQWVPRQGQAQQPMRIGNKDLTLPYLLDLKGAPPIFQKGYLSGFQCVSEVAR